MTEGKKKHVLQIMDNRHGHLTKEWDLTDQASIDAAQTAFQELIDSRKYWIYRLEGEGPQAVGTVVRPGRDKFDPNVERYVATPQMAGG